MSNDEKVLTMLEQLQNRLDDMQQNTNTRFDNMQEDINGIKQAQGNIQQDITDIHERVVKVEVTQEHDVLKGIQLLNEGHVAIDRKLNALDMRTKDVDDIRDNVEVLKHVVRNK